VARAPLPRPLACPLAIQITDLGTVSEAELGRRLDALTGAPEEARGRVVVMVRDPGLSGRDLLALARRLRGRTRELGIGLWMNDRLDVARLVGADGVHLGRRSVEVADARRWLGDAPVISVSCHQVDEVAEARRGGADVALLSPIFASPGKGEALGLDALRKAREGLGSDGAMALVALGGVDAGNVAACLHAGADGVAAIRADVAALVAVAPRG
jgi:thiamine-phosphate pyrophosphorylase